MDATLPPSLVVQPRRITRRPLLHAVGSEVILAVSVLRSVAMSIVVNRGRCSAIKKVLSERPFSIQTA